MESKIERTARKKAIALGWLCWKCIGLKGAPDRLFIKNGVHVFIEIKSPGETPRPLQLVRLKQLTAAGSNAFWADSVEGILEILNKY
jgi:hypothetical protein